MGWILCGHGLQCNVRSRLAQYLASRQKFATAEYFRFTRAKTIWNTQRRWGHPLKISTYWRSSHHRLFQISCALRPQRGSPFGMQTLDTKRDGWFCWRSLEFGKVAGWSEFSFGTREVERLDKLSEWQTPRKKFCRWHQLSQELRSLGSKYYTDFVCFVPRGCYRPLFMCRLYFLVPLFCSKIRQKVFSMHWTWLRDCCCGGNKVHQLHSYTHNGILHHLSCQM